MNRHTLLLLLYLLALIVSGAPCPSVAEDNKAPIAPQTALAMYGPPKYAEGFDHFAYANPDAPKGGILKLGVTGNFDSLNPFIVLGQTPLGLATGTMSLIYEPLMARGWDEPFTLYSLIAESVEVPEDRASITFNLNPKARWSDGQPITADDVLFSFTTLRDKGRPNHRAYYKKVEQAEKLGERRIRFRFRPNPDGTLDREMPLIMALMPILPAHDWISRDFNRTTLHVPVGSGPYQIQSLEQGRSITYSRNPDYWGRDLPTQRGLYNADRIRVDYYRDDNIALQAFKSGAFDWRRELDSNKWMVAYDFPAAHDGRVRLEKLAHHRTEPISGFTFNTRRELFKNPAFREALAHTFDSGWINRNLFHGQYRRTTSFFPNSELAAPPLPEGRELEILNSYRAQLPASLFTSPVTPPETDGSEDSLRTNLLKASALLREAGYVLKDDRLYAPDGDKPVAFEILLSDPTEEKIALAWARALQRIGITVTTKTLFSAQYQARLSAFDYDVVVAKWSNSLSPGNEQAAYWGAASADQQGSRNYAGIKDSVVDALTRAIPAAPNREDLVATAHALDRVLMAGHYVIPFFYLGADTIASWSHLHHPDTMPLYGTVLESWWWE